MSFEDPTTEEKTSVSVLSVLLVSIALFQVIVVFIVIANGWTSLVVHPLFVVSECVLWALFVVSLRSLVTRARSKRTDEGGMGSWYELEKCPKCQKP